MRSTPKKLLILLISGLLALPSRGQDHQERFRAIDVLQYHFWIELSDSSDIILGKAEIEIEFKEALERFQLDLAFDPKERTGMKVSQLTENGKEIEFLQRDNKITLFIPRAHQGAKRSYSINYRGIPADGLIIAANRFGDRTFFGDNWPNRGHFWLPLVDHPSDKALVEFTVSAPDHYGVVSVGEKVSEKKEHGKIHSRWRSTVPLPTKLMVIGVSPFAVQEMQSASGIPVSSWVYPQNREEGFYDYSIATRPLDFFESYIAPYPYAKLANVQSKTIYGGMENASCIFYHERTVNGKQDHELLFAHEIAHQWFGDAVSELDWHHIWLSEGFATYLTDIYIEHSYGRDSFVASMEDERQQVLAFARRRLAPIIDTTLSVSVRLLNKNSYEKAGWVLHMLRHDMGEEKFRECMRRFYEEYKFGNALTEDFREVAEAVSGKKYDSFFKQWFYRSGHPVLSAGWKKRGRKLSLSISQHQKQHVFQFPLEIEISGKGGKSIRKILEIKAAEQTFLLDLPFAAREIHMDPDTWLLFEEYP
jgi:hypothetical protein